MNDEIVETPDSFGAFPRLSGEQIERLAAYGERRRTRAGEVLFREGDPSYDFIVVLAGLVATVEDYSPDARRLRDFLARNRIPHTWIDLEEDERQSAFSAPSTSRRTRRRS